MAAGSTLNTLLDEWQWRRDRLARGPWCDSQFAAEQVRVLDFLIRRYSNTLEGQRPALSPRGAAVQINDRAIVVLHHVGKNKVVGIKSAQEAESRAARILKRMASAVSADVEGEAAVGEITHDDSESEIALDPLVWSSARSWVLADFPISDSAIAAGLAVNPFLTKKIAEHLYRRIVTPDSEDTRAAELLVQGQNRTALRFALYAWRELTASHRRDAVWSVLDRFLSRPDSPPAIIEGMRMFLSDASAQVRLAASEILGTIGELEDVGLLSDLLALPVAADEAPDERASRREKGTFYFFARPIDRRLAQSPRC